MATDSHLLHPWFKCSTTTISFCVSVVFDHAIEPSSLGALDKGRLCGVIDCTADKLQIQYGVLGTGFCVLGT